MKQLRYILPVSFLLLPLMGYTQSLSIPERLGYPKDSKLLIIHADDLGVSHSENRASIEALERGMVNSASIMVPAPWFPEIAAYAKAHPELDFGLHLTLTSEWDLYKWRPLTLAPGLIAEDSFFPASQGAVSAHATPEEVERELRAQIEMALRYGINVTHLDTHMMTIFQKSAYVKVYKKLGREYGLPVLLDRRWSTMGGIDPAEFLDADDIVIDQLYMALPDDDQTGLKRYYSGLLSNLQPGFNVILLHAAFDDAEMQAVTVNHPDFGARWRQEDLGFFTSKACRKLIAREGIQLITWREIKEKLIDTQ